MNMLVTSPMRVGSTWVHELLCDLFKPDHRDFVRSSADALTVVARGGTCVLKSHRISAHDLPILAGHLHSIRVLRNFKDCLISRAFYCRNVLYRRDAKSKGTPAEESALSECGALGDVEFVNTFLSIFADLGKWVEAIVMYERGSYDHTFYYEMLIHNARDELWHWINKAGLTSQVDLQKLDEALHASSFKKMKARKTPGFVGSTGVGGWMHLLDEPVSAQLDELYHRYREMMGLHPGGRSYVSPAEVGKVPWFGGGIGDVFLQCCTTDRYRVLNSPDCPKLVVNSSRNEYAEELFRWHPNAGQFTVIRAAKEQTDKRSTSEFFQSMGLDGRSAYEGFYGQSVDWNTTFYPAPKDHDVLGRYENQDFGIFAPYSKETKTLRTALCQDLLPRLNSALARFSLLGFGRHYKTVNERTQDLKQYADEGWLTDLSEHDLSVPGSFELARRAKFYVGANSCLALVTMSQGKPTVIIEPDAHTNPNFWPRMFDVDQCLLIQKFSAVNLDGIIEFLTSRLGCWPAP